MLWSSFLLSVIYVDISHLYNVSYRDPYKEAYRKYMETDEERYLVQMEEIAEILGNVSDTTDFDFDIGKWEEQVDEKYGFDQ